MATMAAILEIYFALLLNQKANLSGNQVSDTGPSWPTCIEIRHVQRGMVEESTQHKWVKKTTKKSILSVARGVPSLSDFEHGCV